MKVDSNYIANPKGTHADLVATIESVYKACDFDFDELVIDHESRAYGSASFILNNRNIIFRAAKITPKKIGQFVTLWFRNEKGVIQPYDESSSIDFVVVSVRHDALFGQFVFPKDVLVKKKIISSDKHSGKLAIRVYPPWDKTLSQQAKKTQAWQLEYFLEIPERAVDAKKVRALYGFDGSL